MNIKFLSYIIIISLFFTLTSCKKDKTIEPEKISYSKAAAELPYYDNFIRYFKSKGYTFYSFHQYLQINTSDLPDKLIVIRHDVHHRDIENSYYMALIENELIGNKAATYFVMLNFPLEKKYDNYSQLKNDYLELINYLKNQGYDVQPHISPWDEYIEQYSPWWQNINLDKLKNIVKQHYSYKITDNYYEIIYKSTDTLNFKQAEIAMPEVISNYNTVWYNETGLKVETFAAHGSESAINHAFSNVIMINLQNVREQNLFKIETSSPEIQRLLYFLSDNDRPTWIEHPEEIEQNGHFQLLAHPEVWKNPQEYRNQNH